MVCLPCQGLVSLVSKLVSQLVFFLVSLCWMVCPRSRGSCFPLSPIASLLVSPCWMVCPPSCFPLLDGVSVFPSPWLPSWFPLLDGVFPRSCLPFSPSFSRFSIPFVGWCFGLPKALSPFSQLSQLVFLVFICWMVCPPSRGLVSLVFSLSSFLFRFIRWCVRLPEVFSPFLFLFVGWCVHLPEALFPFSQLVPQLVSLVSELVPNLFLIPFVGWCACLLSYFPLLDDVSAFPKPCFLCPQACLPVCLPFFPFVGRCVRLPEALSPLFPSLSPSLSSSLFPFVFRYLVLRQS